MIIDRILDRKDDIEAGIMDYRPKQFYLDCLKYGRVGDGITMAMDYGEEDDVKRALCEYVIDNEYNPEICDFVKSVNWLEADA